MPHRSDYVYDAWNRVVEVRLPDADSPIAPIEAFEYDGLNRRIRKTVTNWGTGIVMDSLIDTEGVQAGDREERYFYAGWRVIEERTGGGDVIAQTVWGTEYIDAPICRDRNTKFETTSCLDESSRRYFYHQDINFRVTALTDESGEIVERYDYDAYGAARIYSGGAVANSGEGGVLLAVSSVGNPYMHQGLRRDDETGTFENRMRCYNPRIGRFMQRDPAGYVDGANLYEYVGSNAVTWLDPMGLSIFVHETTDSYGNTVWHVYQYVHAIWWVWDEVFVTTIVFDADDPVSVYMAERQLSFIEAQVALNDLAKGAIATHDFVIIMLGVVIPGPDDAIWAALAAAKGLKWVKGIGWIKKNGKQLTDAEWKELLDEAAEARRAYHRSLRKALNLSDEEVKLFNAWVNALGDGKGMFQLQHGVLTHSKTALAFMSMQSSLFSGCEKRSR